MSPMEVNEEFESEANSSLINLTDDLHTRYFEGMISLETKNLLNLTIMWRGKNLTSIYVQDTEAYLSKYR